MFRRARLSALALALLMMLGTAGRSMARTTTVATRVAGPTGALGTALTRPGTALRASSDFNGDGYPDLAIGVPHDATKNANDAGAVNILYGSSVGIQVDNPADQRWSQDSLDVKGTAESGDQFGAAVATGDFNGDGFADLAVGAPGDSCDNFAGAGVVNVLYGTAAGLQADAPDNQLWTQDSTDVLDQCETSDAFGGALAAGDFNADGFVDLAIGAPGEAIGNVAKAGAVNVLYGSAAGLQSDAPGNQFWRQGASGVQGKAEDSDQFGFSLAAGDFNGDGVPDLGIGVYGEDVSGLDKAGAVAVLYGTTAAGLQASSPDDQLWNRDSANVQDAADTFDHFGSCLAAGDFNGDGFDDLAIGVFGDDIGNPEIQSAGSVQVLYGTAGGLQATSPDDQMWDQNSSGVKGKAETTDHFGDAVTAGDFNGDGFADLAIGVPFEDLSNVTDAGADNVLYGTAAGLQADSPDDQQWDQDSTGVKGQLDPSDEYGTALTAADFNGDGFADLVSGIPGEPAGGFDGAGGISGLYGSLGGLQADNPDDVRKTQGSSGVEGDPAAGDNFGASVAAG